MKLLTLMFYLFASIVSAITCLEVETGEASTKIIFKSSDENSLKGTMLSEIHQHGICEGEFFWDIENSRLKLRYASEKCQSQNMSIIIDAQRIFFLAHNRKAVVYYEQEYFSSDPQQASLKICRKRL